jgi:endo-1,4-beta-xylanase
MPFSDKGQPETANRRSVLKGMAAATISALMPFPVAAQQNSPNLAALAAEKGFFFGSALEGLIARQDPEYGQLVAAQTHCITHEWSMKWNHLQPEHGRFDFERPDITLAFAAEHSLWQRGHTLLWHESLPDWAPDKLTGASSWDRIIAPYLDVSIGRYGTAMRHWDVVNEVIDPHGGRSDMLRPSPLTEAFGEDLISLAFGYAHDRLPQTRLYYNDYGLEYELGWMREKRRATLIMLERWLGAGVPIHGFGVQSHLHTMDHEFNQHAFQDFLTEIAGLGLEIVLSELDVRQPQVNAPLQERVGLVADHTREFLDAALSVPAVKGVVTWGLSDRYSWLRDRHEPDNHGLPFDSDLRPSPMLSAMADAFSGAPAR